MSIHNQISIDWSRVMNSIQALWDKISQTTSIVEFKINPDGSWYRKWSDGWLEQSIWIAESGADTTKVINLLQPFQDDKYTILFQKVTAKTEGNSANDCIRARTTTNFTLYTGTNQSGNIYACGKGTNWHHEGSLPSEPGLEDLLG